MEPFVGILLTLTMLDVQEQDLRVHWNKEYIACNTKLTHSTITICQVVPGRVNYCLLYATAWLR